MRKFDPSCILSPTRLLMTLALLLSGIMFAKADDPVPLGNERQVMKSGVTYSYQKYTTCSGVYTAEADGKLIIEGGQDLSVYSKWTEAGGYEDLLTPTAVDVIGSTSYLMVKKDDTLFFYARFPLNSKTVTLFMEGVSDAPLDIKYMQPAQNEIVDFNVYPTMLITFNQNVKLSSRKAMIKFHDRLTDSAAGIEVNASPSNNTLSVPLYNPLKSYIQSGAIKPGDEFSVTLSDLTAESDEKYTDALPDGSATFTFLCGNIPLVAIERYCPDTFLSYWPAGTKEGILTMTFNGNLGQSEGTFCELGWGNQEGEDGEYYVERIPVSIEGNSLSVDFTGKLRTPATMTPLYPTASYSMISVKVVGVVDEHGVPVGSEGSGTVGSYSFGPAYKVVERGNVATEFEPNSGTALDLAKTVSVWISGTNAFTFDGFKLEGEEKSTGKTASIIVPMTDVKVISSAANEAEYEFSMPLAVLSDWKSATVTLNNVVSLDGYDHSNDVRATYGGFVITYSEPANGTEFATLSKGTKIMIESNLAKEYPNMYVMYEIIDTDPSNPDPVIKSQSWMNRQEDGSYMAEIYGNYKLMYGHDYKVLVTAWPDENTKNYTPDLDLGSDFFFIKGLTAPYIYSTTALSSLSPEPESVLPSDCNEIVLTFDGLVNLGRTKLTEEDIKEGRELETFINTGMGTSMAFEAVVPEDPTVENGVTYSNIWKLQFSDGFIAGKDKPIDISFKAYDVEGRLVQGTNGSDELTYFYYFYKVAGQYKEVSVDLPSPLTSMSEFVVSQELGILPSWSLPLSDAKIYNMKREVVASVNDYRVPEATGDRDELITSLTLVLDKEITAPGSYVIIIPENYFSIGTEFSAYNSAAVSLPFDITEAFATAEPAPGKVEALEQIVVTYSAEVRKAEGATETPYCYSPELDYKGSFRQVTVDGNAVTLEMRARTTEPGTYEVNIPEGFLQYADGTPVPAVKFIYTITDQPREYDLTVTPAVGTVTELPASIDIVFNEYDEVSAGSGKATLTIDGGTPVNLPDAGVGIEWNEMLQDLPQAYTANGTYVITFPAGYFNLGSSGETSEEITLTYIIGGAPALEATFNPAPGTVTELPATIDIVFNDYDEVSAGSGKATLTINGGTPVNLPDAGVGIEWNEMLQDLPQAYTEDGTYVLHFPAGYFNLGSSGDIQSKEMTVTYIIDKSSGIAGVDVEAGRYTVYSVDGVLLLDSADRDAFRALAPGLYIVNGVKVILK